jgi:hypothetical protein
MKMRATGRNRTALSSIQRTLRFFLIFALAGMAGMLTDGQPGPSMQKPMKEGTVQGLQIIIHGGYPELRIAGVPFFIHSAAFHYYRIPRDQWSYLLDRYRELGINTIDIYIPWNWHEPHEGEFDFDGHTNPRRDLRGLLQLITADGFKLIARPGPQILNEWKNGGYPDWLLTRPEYHMDPVDVLEGRYPPLSGLNTRNAEAAAQAWLDNPVHMKYAQTWLEAVAHELAPYSAGEAVAVPISGSPHQFNGPLLYVQLEDDMAIGRTNYAGPSFWQYMQALRSMLRDGGLRVPAYINPTDMRVSAAGEGLADPIGAMGQWYMAPRKADSGGQRLFDDEDASEIEFYTEELKTQPYFPPIMIEYQAGWYSPGDDDRPVDSPVENTLLSSRLLLAHGIHGFNYFPLQDTVTPAGYSVPWANRFYRWDAPLDVNGSDQPRAAAVLKNADLFKIWGAQLAASHKRPDFGIIYPLGSFPQEKLTSSDISLVSQTILRLEMLGQLTHLSSELLDPEYQPVDQLLRDAVILLPVFDPTKPEFLMSEKSQRELGEYVRRGGILVMFPTRPSGIIFSQFWLSSANSAPESGLFARETDYGSGHVLELKQDFSSWIDLDEDYSHNSAQARFRAAASDLPQILEKAGVRPVVKLEYSKQPSNELVVTELVSNEGTDALGARTGGRGFLSVTNLYDRSTTENLEILSPLASARRSGDSDFKSSSGDADTIPLHIEIPARESLLLPLEQSLCSAATRYEQCSDSIIASGAEFLSAERVGKTLELTFYSPTRATVLLHLQEKPKMVTMLQNLPRVRWDGNSHELHLSVPRGASPDFLRTIKLELRYQPFVPPKPKAKPAPSQNYSFRVLDAVPLALGDTASLQSYPPLVVLDSGRQDSLLLEARNLSGESSGKISVQLEGPIKGSASLHPRKELSTLGKLRLNWPAERGRKLSGISPGPDGLVHEMLVLHSAAGARKLPIAFLIATPGSSSHYQFDFDQDGANEWVLENDRVRLIFSPAAGGDLWSFVDKDAAYDLLSSVGGLRDGFSYAKIPPGESSARERGRYGLFNRFYIAKWDGTGGGAALEMNYDASDILPNGAAIQKVIRLDGSDDFRADYSVSLASPQAATQFAHPQSFVVMNSVPVSADAQRPTRFCWSASGGNSGIVSASTSQSDDPTAEHCETFVPGGKPIVVPSGVDVLRVHTLGRPGLSIQWKAGQMTIEPKAFSALLKLQFPPLTPGGEAEKYSIRFHVLRAE